MVQQHCCGGGPAAVAKFTCLPAPPGAATGKASKTTVHRDAFGLQGRDQIVALEFSARLRRLDPPRQFVVGSSITGVTCSNRAQRSDFRQACEKSSDVSSTRAVSQFQFIELRRKHRGLQFAQGKCMIASLRIDF